MSFIKVDYVWLDGTEPTQQLRSKVRVLPYGLNTFPQWTFDGSSTNQAEGKDSDLILNPVYDCRSPNRGDDGYIVLCEVLNPDGTPHSSNAYDRLIKLMAKATDYSWLGFEQEYVLYNGNRILGWSDTGYPPFGSSQGPYYCSVGADVAFGRKIAEEHLDACLNAGLTIHGINAEVLPGQWEFQIGYRGSPYEIPGALKMCHELWIARYLLLRIAEDYGVVVSFYPKPMPGDWNGSGLHTNFSTYATRDKKDGLKAIHEAINRLSFKHDEHIAVYGAHNEERLTGNHETCDISEFKHGDADRGSSIRIPRHVVTAGCGYFEDRRPAANADPYKVAYALIKTILVGEDES